MNNSGSEYEKRAKEYQKQGEEQASRLNRISNFRLLTALIGFGGFLYLYFHKQETAGIAVFLSALLLFLYLVVRHNRLKREKDRIDILRKINEDSLKRLNGEWRTLEDTGKEYQDPEHDFSEDLDVFGRNSLFQWMNTAKTFAGRNALKKLLTDPPKKPEEIRERQAVAKELAGLLDWRQQLQAEALLSADKFQDPRPFYEWVRQRSPQYHRPAVRWLVQSLPPVLILLFTAAFVFPAFPFFIPYLFLLLQMGLTAYHYTERKQILDVVAPFLGNIKTERAMLEKIEDQEFHSAYLKKLQQGLRNEQGETACRQIKGLERIMDRTAVRHSQLYWLINILFLWDYQSMVVLEKWKEQSGDRIRDWIEALGEMEALCSLAVLYYDHPDWAVPKIYGDDRSLLFAAEAGHPLLPEDRVCNDIDRMKSGQVFLITGSNMSGKSTLLRTVGINLVLAYAGAPVCAKEFHCTVFDLYTSMRVRDDLEGRISSFYAELLRIKRMIEAAKRGEPVFFLLDEIFKGTNSRDRHTGARILIKLLSSEGAVGFVSTHDVELGDLEKEDSRIRNYHFREYYREGKLFFDYKLRKGVSNTRNAVYLMKMAGMDIPEAEMNALSAGPSDTRE